MLLLLILFACEESSSSYEYPVQLDSAQHVNEITLKEEFPAAMASYSCRLYSECDLLQGYGGGIEECYDAVKAGYTSQISNDCNWNEEMAIECLFYIQSATCDDLNDDEETSCDLVCGREWE